MYIEKKKRTHSGSRSKSGKYRGYQYSVDLRGKHSVTGTKVKTENSSSVHKSRPSRKNSTKQKKHTKSNNKDSKEPASHSVSADRRHSVIKINRTQANFDNQQLQILVDQLLMGLRSIPQPPCLNARLVVQYFSDMKRFYRNLEGPFQRLCSQLHQFYVSPMHKFLELVSPMEEVIRKKEQIAKEIDKQIIQNEQLYSQLQPIDIEIFKLKQKIEQNRAFIDKKRQEKEERHRQRSLQTISQPEEQSSVERGRNNQTSKGFKLDLDHIKKLGHMGYHEQFYSKLDQFSESWRDQAIREKRF